MGIFEEKFNQVYFLRIFEKKNDVMRNFLYLFFYFRHFVKEETNGLVYFF